MKAIRCDATECHKLGCDTGYRVRLRDEMEIYSTLTSDVGWKLNGGAGRHRSHVDRQND